MDKILCEHSEHITTITLNNPDKRNAFDAHMSQAMIAFLHEAEQKEQRVVVLKANPSHHIFSAGHNLNELTSAHEIVNDPMFAMFDCISNLSIPLIAQVSGNVYAGALHLLMVCDMVYAMDDSSVIITANKMGVPFSLRNYQNWLSVMGLHKIKELFFTAGMIDAKDAYNAGIFNAIFPSEELLQTKVNEVCQQIISCCAQGIANSKLQLNTLANNVVVDYEKAILIEESRQNILSSDSFKERVLALINKIQHKK